MHTSADQSLALIVGFLAFDDLLRNELYKADLALIFAQPDDAVLAAYLMETLPVEWSEEDKLATVKEIYELTMRASLTVLEVGSALLGQPLDEQLFKRITKTFTRFNEPWEKHLGLPEFSAYAAYHEAPGTTPALPLHHTLAITYVLALGLQRFDELKNDELNVMGVFLMFMERLVSLIDVR